MGFFQDQGICSRGIPQGQSGVRIPGFQSAGYLFTGGQYLSSTGFGGKALCGNEPEACADCSTARNHGDPEKISLRGVGRTEAAGGRGQGIDHKPKADTGG